MKVLSRDFTLKEKLLILVLVVVLLGLAYYQFVDKPIRTTIANNEAEAQSLQTELDGVQARLAHLRSVESSLEALKESGNYTWMGSYNNREEELAFLNVVLADTLQYSISFANVTRNGNQIRRSFTLQYVVTSYREAQRITQMLIDGKQRCLIGDISCSISSNGTVTMNQSATFYETMVDGTPDAALPKDSAAANS